MLSPSNSVKTTWHRLPQAVPRRLTWTVAWAALMVAVGSPARGQVPADNNKPASATWINQNQTSDPFRLPGGSAPNPQGAMPSGAMPLSEQGEEPATEGELDWFDRKGPALPADCCKSCPSFWYGQLEAVFARRDDSNLAQVTGSLVLGEFDWHTGARLTVGRQADCLEALELVYTGINNWEASDSITSALPTLQSAFNGSGGIFDLDDFSNATSQSVTYETNFNSFELNRRRWGWDIISTVFGFRYINLEEQFNLLSSPGPTFGQYNVKADNNLFGFQIGGDMLYPVGPGMNLAAKGKIGLFGNSASQTTRIFNNSAPVLVNGDDKLDYSALLELGGYATYRVRPRFTLKAGYEFWYLWHAALATEQVNFNIGPATGAYLKTDGHLMITAFTVGGEFQW